MFLDETINITRLTKAYNSIGEMTENYVSHLTNIKCSFQNRSGDTNIINTVDMIRSNLRVYTNVIDITENDRIVKGSITYKIIAIGNKRNNHLEIDIERLI